MSAISNWSLPSDNLNVFQFTHLDSNDWKLQQSRFVCLRCKKIWLVFISVLLCFADLSLFLILFYQNNLTFDCDFNTWCQLNWGHQTWEDCERKTCRSPHLDQVIVHWLPLWSRHAGRSFAFACRLTFPDQSSYKFALILKMFQLILGLRSAN